MTVCQNVGRSGDLTSCMFAAREKMRMHREVWFLVAKGKAQVQSQRRDNRVCGRITSTSGREAEGHLGMHYLTPPRPRPHKQARGPRSTKPRCAGILASIGKHRRAERRRGNGSGSGRCQI
jgi:hypothetical protein